MTLVIFLGFWKGVSLTNSAWMLRLSLHGFFLTCVKANTCFKRTVVVTMVPLLTSPSCNGLKTRRSRLSQLLLSLLLGNFGIRVQGYKRIKLVDVPCSVSPYTLRSHSGQSKVMRTYRYTSLTWLVSSLFCLFV